jgi:hypothetical protein
MGRALAAITPENAASFFAPTLAIGRGIKPYECRCERLDFSEIRMR